MLAQQKLQSWQDLTGCWAVNLIWVLHATLQVDGRGLAAQQGPVLGVQVRSEHLAMDCSLGLFCLVLLS
jgi:hypothetical protein